MVDAAVGTILRVAARPDATEFRVSEPAGDTFGLELPGVEAERWELPDYEKRGPKR
ncbi:MAG: hypothetical protein AVDCRST_MAG02-203 [uncultured Rubrobacteraceae bacterium]|uniref:Uncharacterized protein n=1 Tax=uncultured Rubrobacteraceae bacterium TaxID=349277 RepID=A0A6J4QEG0_9ACTN|nr:MAG: hypothetical protein AVDCRST_MAG02-203 [uncultured Rubrobacteraceae bacterium]